MNKVKSSNRGILGLFLVLVGVVLLLGNLNFLPANVNYILFSWPMILIAIGVFNLFRKDYTSGIILLAVGTFFILPRAVEGLSFHDVFKFWPLLVIFAGLMFFMRRKHSFSPTPVIKGTPEEVIDEVNIFGGGATQIESNNFKGGKITSIFGGSEINMERCKLSEQGAVLDFVAIFGGSQITVPRGWTVKTEVVSIFGGFSDKRAFLGESTTDPSKTLVIKGVAIFGGGELRSF